MWRLTQPWWEFVARGLIVYAFIFILLRLTGRKQIGQLTPFDLVLLLIISNAVQNSMNAGDNSVTAGLILAATLVGMNVILNDFMFRSRKFERLMEGSAKVLIHNGVIHQEVMHKESITKQDLDTALREQGVDDVKNVRFAIIEPNGQITVLKKEKPSTA